MTPSNYGILDPKFKYVPASKTDLAKTFARIRRETAEQERLRQADGLPADWPRELSRTSAEP